MVVEYLKDIQPEIPPIKIEWGSEITAVETSTQKVQCFKSSEVARIIARTVAECQLYGSSPIEKTEVDHWLTYAAGPLSSKHDFLNAVQYLNRVLGPLTYLVGKRITIADFAVFAALYCKSILYEMLLSTC